MALPELARRLVEAKLTAYCERKVPIHVRNEVRLSFSVRGHSVTLSEERDALARPGTWVATPIAQLRFDPDHEHWTLYCANPKRREGWLPYRHALPAKDIGALLYAIDSDQTGVFWG